MSNTRLAISYINEFGTKFTQSISAPENTTISLNEQDFLAKSFNNFLRHIGYIRPNDFMLMEDLTEDELEALTDFLQDYREDQKK